MVNWSSLPEITKDSGTCKSIIPTVPFAHTFNKAVFTKVIYALLGIYVWEILGTVDFEWSLITRKRKFTWPLVSRSFCLLFSIAEQRGRVCISHPLRTHGVLT